MNINGKQRKSPLAINRNQMEVNASHRTTMWNALSINEMSMQKQVENQCKSVRIPKTAKFSETEERMDNC